MLKVSSFLRLSGGSLGDTTFLKVKGEYTARNKKVVNPKKFKTDPKLARVRENSGDFTMAAKSGKLVRNSIEPISPEIKEGTVTRRLLTEMMRVIKSDVISTAGNGNVRDGNYKLLIGFNFNINSRLRAAFNVNYTTEINRETGDLIINIPSFNPATNMKAPAGATHYKISSAGIAVDFVSLKKPKAAFFTSPLLPIDGNNTVALTISNNVSVGAQDRVFLTLGIQFFKVAGQWMSNVSNNSGDCMAIVDAG